jgi:hypothetical protein
MLFDGCNGYDLKCIFIFYMSRTGHIDVSRIFMELFAFSNSIFVKPFIY